MGDPVVGSKETVSIETPQGVDGAFAVVIAGLQTFPVKIKGGVFVFPKDPSISGQVIFLPAFSLFMVGS